MSGYGFSDELQNVLAIAAQEALARASAKVDPVDMLAALVKHGKNRGCVVLDALEIDRDEFMRRIHEQTLLTQSTSIVVGPDMPYSEESVGCLEFAMQFAQGLVLPGVGTEHLLLGILRGGARDAGVAAELGVTFDRARIEVLRLPKEFE